MNLIDVDKLKQYIGDCKCCEKCPNKGRKQYECYYDCKFPDYLTEEWERVLDEQPTIDAIPIEWLYALAEKKESEKDMKLSLMIKGVVALWHKEQEKQNDNN